MSERDPATAQPESSGTDPPWTGGHVRNVRPIRRREAPRREGDKPPARNGSDPAPDAGGPPPAGPSETTSFYDLAAAEPYAPIEEQAATAPEQPHGDQQAIDDSAGRECFPNGGDPGLEDRAAPGNPVSVDEPEVELALDDAAHRPEPLPADEPASLSDDADAVSETEVARPARVVWRSKPRADTSAPPDAVTQAEAARTEDAVAQSAVHDDSPTAAEPEAAEAAAAVAEPASHKAIRWPPPKPAVVAQAPSTGPAASEPIAEPPQQPDTPAEPMAGAQPEGAPARDEPEPYPSPPPSAPAAGPLGFRERGRVRQRARYLHHLREVQIRDLGGFVLELYRFDKWRGDLVGVKLAEVAETDRELRALEGVLGEERPLREVREAGIGGVCGQCATIHGSVDRFCAACGAPLAGATPESRRTLPRGRRAR